MLTNHFSCNETSRKAWWRCKRLGPRLFSEANVIRYKQPFSSTFQQSKHAHFLGPSNESGQKHRQTYRRQSQRGLFINEELNSTDVNLKDTIEIAANIANIHRVSIVANGIQLPAIDTSNIRGSVKLIARSGNT